MTDDGRRRAAETLGVAETATPDEIRRAFRAAMHAAHPDRGGSERLVRDLVEARRVLTSPPSREVRPAASTQARLRGFHRRRGLHRWWRFIVRRRQEPVVNRRVL